MTESGKEVVTALAVARAIAVEAARVLLLDAEEMNSAKPWFAARGTMAAWVLLFSVLRMLVATGAARDLISISSSLQRS